jgi:hypothetical protein
MRSELSLPPPIIGGVMRHIDVSLDLTTLVENNQANHASPAVQGFSRQGGGNDALYHGAAPFVYNGAFFVGLNSGRFSYNLVGGSNGIYSVLNLGGLVLTRPNYDDEPDSLSALHWRIIAIIQFLTVATNPPAGDSGLFLYARSAITAHQQTSTGGIANSPGLGVGIDINGNALFSAKAGMLAGSTESSVVLTPGTTWLNRWRTVDIRLHPATPSADASVEIFLDRVLALTRDWGTDASLPTHALNSEFIGFKAMVGKNGSANVATLNVAGFRIIAASHAAALL